MTRAVAAWGLLLLVATACSDKKTASPATTSTVVATTTSTATATSTAGATTSSPSATTTAPPASATTTTTLPGTEVVAEAGGWRLAVSQPRAGATVGPVLVLCYGLTGTSREPEVTLEVSVLVPGPSTVVRTIPVRGAVGRNAARVDLAGVSPGRYDVRVQMVVNGVRLDGGAATVPGVMVAPSAAEATCT